MGKRIRIGIQKRLYIVKNITESIRIGIRKHPQK